MVARLSRRHRACELDNVARVIVFAVVGSVGSRRRIIVDALALPMSTIISAVWLGTDFSGADIIGFAMIISTVLIISLFNKKSDAH